MLNAELNAELTPDVDSDHSENDLLFISNAIVRTKYLLPVESGGDGGGDAVVVRLNLNFGLESPLNAVPNGNTQVAFVSGTGTYWQSCDSISVPIL